MVKGEKFQKLVLFGGMCAGALLCAEAYLQGRAFVARVDAAERQVALLKQEVEALRVQVDVTPRPASPAPAPVIAAVSPSLTLPIPEPMRIAAVAPERFRKTSPAAEASHVDASAPPGKTDEVPDDGRVVLMKDAKEAKAATQAPSAAQQAVATPTVDVKLWAKK